MTKILIIEDDPLLSRMYEVIFTGESYEVESAGDGIDGLEKARTSQPTLILLDIMMPRLNGIEVLKKIKADPDLKRIPVVVLTNLAGDTDVMTAMELGAVRYIIKSENKPKEVEAIVRDILSGYTRNEIPASVHPA